MTRPDVFIRQLRDLPPAVLLHGGVRGGVHCLIAKQVKRRREIEVEGFALFDQEPETAIQRGSFLGFALSVRNVGRLAWEGLPGARRWRTLCGI